MYSISCLLGYEIFFYIYSIMYFTERSWPFLKPTVTYKIFFTRFRYFLNLDEHIPGILSFKKMFFAKNRPTLMEIFLKSA
jgi:hypothetical protein